MSQQVGLFGGTFNPIHFGHLIAARSVAEQLRLERTIFLPSSSPPHKKGQNLIDGRHRAEMVRLAINGEPGFELSDYDLVRPGPSYSVETVAHFRKALGKVASIVWIIGTDSLAELDTWYRLESLVEQCRMVTASRPGWTVGDLEKLRQRLSPEQVEGLRSGILETPRIDISASGIRERVRIGQSIRYLTPEPVCRYIEEHGLYRGQ